jgi:phosphatidylglycerol:prolipoprotein diacylglycerol transferase
MIEWWQHIPETLDPIAFTIGFFSVYWYALWFLAGFFAVFSLALRSARRGEVVCSEECVSDMLFYIFFSALLGGHLGYALFYNLDASLAAPLTLFLPYDFGRGVWVGISGMSYHGGLIGAGLALYWFARRKRLSFWKMADFLAFLAPIAAFFGRLGNFFNVELPGRITEQPWGMIFPNVLPQGMLRHPSVLYEAFLEGIVLFGILIFFRKRMPFPGALACLYLASYAALRFIGEFFRSPDPQLGFIFGSPIAGITLGQVLSFWMFFAAGMIFMWLKYRNRGKMMQSH